MPRPIEIHEPDDRSWSLGEERRRVLAELAADERTSTMAVIDAARDLGIQRTQCYALLRRFRQEPTVTALLPRARGRTRGARMLSPEAEALVAAAIDEFYLVRCCPTLAALVREIERRCAEKGLKAPSRKAITSRIRAHDQQEVLRRRRGAAYARSKLGRIVGRLAEDQPLGLVQVDHTLADVIVVSEGDRRPLQRPWLTLAVDVATRMVTGFYLSLETPSALSVTLHENMRPMFQGFSMAWLQVI